MKKDFLIVVDVQPEFDNACEKILDKVINKINETQQSIIVFYVGKELGRDDRYDVQEYFMKNGVDYGKIDSMYFIEKDYGFFRGWMDHKIDDEIIINTIKLMRELKINDTRDLEEQDWKRVNCNKEITRINPLFMPSFKSGIFKESDSFELIGGGRDECLKEIYLFLKALNKDVEINESLCYGRDGFCLQDNKKAIKKNKR